MNTEKGTIRKWLGKFTVGGITIATLLFINFPLINTFILSLKPKSAIHASPPPLIRFQPQLQHYFDILFSSEIKNTIDFPLYLANSIVIATVASALVTIVCLPAAYSIVRYKFGGKLFFSGLVNMRAIPLVIFAVPIYLIYKNFGLVDTRIGLILIDTFINIPLALLIFVGFIQDLPVELEEAARIDGAGIIDILRYVIFPLMKPAIMTVTILSFIYAWNEYLFGLILSLESSVPVTVGTTLFVGAWEVEWGPIAAAITIGVLPSFILIIFARRYIVKGLTSGAMKQ